MWPKLFNLLIDAHQEGVGGGSWKRVYSGLFMVVTLGLWVYKNIQADAGVFVGIPWDIIVIIGGLLGSLLLGKFNEKPPRPEKEKVDAP